MTSPSLLKIDRAIYKLGEALLKGQDLASKQGQTMASIDRHIDRIGPS